MKYALVTMIGLMLSGCSIYPAYTGSDMARHERCKLEGDKEFAVQLRGDTDTAAWANVYATQAYERCMK